MTTTQNSPLRFGVIADNMVLEAWQADCIKFLMNSEHANAAVFIQSDPFVQQNPKPYLWRRYFSKRVRKRSKCLKPVDLKEMLSELPMVNVRLNSLNKTTRSFSTYDIEQIKIHDLDFILWFSSGILKGKILTLARYGVWSYHHDDPSKYRGRPACFWEFYNNDPITGAILQQLTNKLDGGPILHQGWFYTEKDSYVTNLDTVYFNSANWPEQVCARLHKGGPLINPISKTEDSLKSSLYKLPKNGQMMIFFIKQFKNSIYQFFFDLFVTDDWHVGIVNQPIHKFIDPNFKPEINWLPRGEKGTYIADPFGYKKGNIETLFVEKFDFASHKGTIVAYTSIDGGEFENEQSIFDFPYHLSYPHLIEDNNEIYCLPECHQSGALSIYKALDFPTKWEKVSTVIDNFPAVDSTVIKYEGKWWLFCTNASNLKRSGLHIWYSSDLTGDWKPHSMNPVKIDIRNSRPAGSPFLFEGVIYRPTQDCTKTYGGALRMNKILSLSPDEFQEETVRLLEPDPKGTYSKGLHHLSSIGDRTLIDGKRYIFSSKDFYRKLSFKRKKIIKKQSVITENG